jgi:outer membrane protein assembly factor BamB
MRRPPFLTIICFGLICLILLYASIFGQKRTFVEIDLTKCWSYSLGGSAGEQIISDGGRIFIGSGDGKIEALSLDGKKSWSSEFGGQISSNILAADSGLFFATSTFSSDTAKSAESKLRSVSRETGITNWTVKLPDAEEHYLNKFNGDVIVVSKNGALQSFDAKQGGLKWTREIGGGFVTQPKFTLTEIIVATIGNQIINLSMATGQINSVRKTAFGITALTVIENDVLIAGDERGNIFSLNRADKPLWSFKAGGRISGLLAVGDHVLAASHDNFVYFLSGRNGSRDWKKRLSGRVVGVADLLDQHALLYGSLENGGMLVDLSNGRVAGQIVLDDEESIVSAPVVSSQDSPIFILTNESAYAFSLNGQASCSK